MTYCQKCGQKRECSLVKVNTSGLHKHRKDRPHPFGKLKGRQGSVLLSVCSECA